VQIDGPTEGLMYMNAIEKFWHVLLLQQILESRQRHNFSSSVGGGGANEGEGGGGGGQGGNRGWGQISLPAICICMHMQLFGRFQSFWLDCCILQHIHAYAYACMRICICIYVHKHGPVALLYGLTPP
jgi:hypothetical protein